MRRTGSRARRLFLAICLQHDKSLSVIGLDTSGEDLPNADYFAEADWWSVSEDDGAGIGDALIIGIEGASSRAIYLDQDGALAGEWQGD